MRAVPREARGESVEGGDGRNRGWSCPTPRRTCRGALVARVLRPVGVGGAGRGQPFTGAFSPTIISERADLNGDGVVNGADDSNDFYGDTDIIDGMLDCNAWGLGDPNDGSAGDGVILANDDCTLVGYDGTPDGVTIVVSGGEFQVADGPLPTVFNALDPDNPDIGDSDFAWSAIGGRVDSNGDETIDGDDCHFGLIGQTVDAGLGDATDGADVLGNPGANECGFVLASAGANNGFVDLNSDTVITALADSCTGCFFGLDVVAGLVQAPGPDTITLEPADATNTVGAPHLVTATVEDMFGNPVVGEDVHFAVTGDGTPDPASGDVDTDAAGKRTSRSRTRPPATTRSRRASTPTAAWTATWASSATLPRRPGTRTWQPRSTSRRRRLQHCRHRPHGHGHRHGPVREPGRARGRPFRRQRRPHARSGNRR